MNSSVSLFLQKRMKMNRILRSAAAVAALTVLIILCSAFRSYGVDVIYQSDMALQPYSTWDYGLVYNSNLAMSHYSSAYSNSTTLSSTSGPETEFQSLIYTGIPNPQSMTVAPDGKTAWVMASYASGSDNSRRGRVYRVDLSQYYGQEASADENTSAVTAGPVITTGHGQTLSYNPVTNELWYVRETKVENTTLVQVDPDTLDVVKEIHFRFSNRVDYPPTFVFDREGNCWTYTRSIGSSWVPRGAIRFYKGKIEDDHVTFEMVNQGLRYPPGYLCQAFGYNAANDRLYVVSDGEYISLPASKAGEWTEDDVETTIFAGERREFEGIAFSEEGCCFLLLNKPSEIMRDRVSYESGLKERARIEQVKETYSKDSEEHEAMVEEEKTELVLDTIGEMLEDGL